MEAASNIRLPTSRKQIAKFYEHKQLLIVRHNLNVQKRERMKSRNGRQIKWGPKRPRDDSPYVFGCRKTGNGRYMLGCGPLWGSLSSPMWSGGGSTVYNGRQGIIAGHGWSVYNVACCLLIVLLKRGRNTEVPQPSFGRVIFKYN